MTEMKVEKWQDQADAGEFALSQNITVLLPEGSKRPRQFV